MVFPLRESFWYNRFVKILTRYVLTEFVVPLGYCLGGFISIYVLFDLFSSFSRILEAKLPFLTIVEYFCGYLAPFFHYLAPAALMLATLYTMWNFCRHSELTAMRANGVSFIAIVKPLIFVAILMAAFVWWVGDYYVPRHSQWARHMKNERFVLAKVAQADNLVFRNVRNCRTWTIDRILDRDAEHLGGVKITIDRPQGGSRLMAIQAGKVDYLDGEWWISDYTIQHYDAAGAEIATPTPELDALTSRAMPQFHEKPSDFLMTNRDWAYNSIRDRLRYLRNHRDLSRDTRDKYCYDTWAKIFAPFACIVITLFAIPAGISSGRQSVFRGVLGALGMFFSFYGLSIGCMIGANLGYLPPFLAAALPPGIFLILGIRAFQRQR